MVLRGEITNRRGRPGCWRPPVPATTAGPPCARPTPRRCDPRCGWTEHHAAMTVAGAVCCRDGVTGQRRPARPRRTVSGREGRHSPRGQEPRVPGGDHPGGRQRVRPRRPRGVRRGRRRRSARRSPTRSSWPPGRRSCPPPTTSGTTGRPDPQGQGADRRGVPPDARRAGAVHLPAPGRLQGVHRRAARPQGDRHRVRDRRAAGPLAAAARPDERGRRPARAAGRRVPPDALRRRPRRADGRRARRVRGQGRGDRRRRLRHERRRDRARHAGRGAAAGQEHRPAARRPTPIYRGHICRPSPPTRTRSSGPCSTPTW